MPSRFLQMLCLSIKILHMYTRYVTPFFVTFQNICKMDASPRKPVAILAVDGIGSTSVIRRLRPSATAS